ncbi:hypothetical protein [Clostridium baratii]|uniref:hypothetical protein n=1 Tax=Clostridium baratii TaxID=1561 RepID=UPI0030CCA36B
MAKLWKYSDYSKKYIESYITQRRKIVHMIKIIARYSNKEEKERIIKGLLKEFNIKQISKPYKTGKYKRICIEI